MSRSLYFYTSVSKACYIWHVAKETVPPSSKHSSCALIVVLILIVQIEPRLLNSSKRISGPLLTGGDCMMDKNNIKSLVFYYFENIKNIWSPWLYFEKSKTGNDLITVCTWWSTTGKWIMVAHIVVLSPMSVCVCVCACSHVDDKVPQAMTGRANMDQPSSREGGWGDGGVGGAGASPQAARPPQLVSNRHWLNLAD